MRYMGGKYYQAKYILPEIDSCVKANKITKYYEPFVGGANVMFRVSEKIERYGNDIDEDLIAYYNHVISGSESYEAVSKELFLDMRENPSNYEKWQLGNVKYMSSFGSKGFEAGYATPGKRTQYLGAITNFKKQIPKLKTVHFSYCDYKDLEIPDRCFVYCDPPYKNTTKYPCQKFDEEEFYNWVKELSKRCFVIISEYSMPKDFTCFKLMPTRARLSGDNTSEVIDKLFYCDGLFKDWYENKEEK